ncbi:phosphatidylserine decarboxylase family protein [Persicobacter sp. CCB-QB2]|uniref:phosphatidylserine decarboxylase family protein n=1 Tax=Persicobacter sp. CCB-QB2 TaxID=1561025 RepID=UPI0006A96931|nr:phosphatidylserine decarboxylase family protein [Persicobacter sp. CCB-QB2]
MTIHREGRTYLTVLLLILAGINAALIYSFPDKVIMHRVSQIVSVIFFLLNLQFFRMPKRKLEISEGQVIAPADGKVVVIEDVMENEYFNGMRKQISIFMSPLNVHNNRAPVNGIVSFCKYHAGKYLVAWHPKASSENERTTMVLKMENGVEVLVRQIAGAMARRIKIYANEGDEYKAGQEYGFIKFGSRVDVFLPLDTKVKVDLNQKTKGGKTVIAELVTED